jgi:hypothetical protein
MDILADRIGGLAERFEDAGVFAEWDPAIINAMTHLLGPRHCVRPGPYFLTTPAAHIFSSEIER